MLAQTETHLGIGDTAPRFSLPDAKGETVDSQSMLADKALVISFYRGRWCPYCSEELKELQRGLFDIEDAGGQLVAISPELPDDSLTIHEKRALAFPILSDVGNKVARKFGLVVSMSEREKAALLGAGLDLAVLNGDDSWETPLPGTFIVDRSGIIRYAFVEQDVSKRPPVREIIQHLNSIR